MAVLDIDTVRSARNSLEKDLSDVPYTKAQINAAFQAVEDTFEGGRNAISNAINAATAPLVLSGAIKRALVRRFLLEKFWRDI